MNERTRNVVVVRISNLDSYTNIPLDDEAINASMAYAVRGQVAKFNQELLDKIIDWNRVNAVGCI